MNNSKIEWTDHTFNPWIGCTKVSPGCTHCYAEARDRRHLIEKVDHWGKGAPRLRTSASYWKEPLKWNKDFICDRCNSLHGSLFAAGMTCAICETGKLRKHRVFCASLADIFDDEVPIEWLADFLALVHKCQNLDFQILTKRPENWLDRCCETFEWVGSSIERHDRWPGTYELLEGWLSEGDAEKAPANVWLGVSAENQDQWDKRVSAALSIPAVVRFVSAEPLLGPIDAKELREIPFKRLHFDRKNRRYSEERLPTPIGIHWVIVGGESGPKARQCNLNWILGLIFQCSDTEVPVFVKQLGGNLSDDDLDACQRCTNVSMKHPKGGDPDEWLEEFRRREFPNIRENSRPFAGKS